MLKLLHHPLCPDSRRVRLAMNEKNLEYDLQAVHYWQRDDAFVALNPAGTLPVLITERDEAICGVNAISEYLEEAYDARNLLGRTPVQRAETRRLIDWFTVKFYDEVTKNLVWEKYFKKLEEGGGPNSKALAAGRANVLYHLDYIEYLTRSKRWLNGDEMTLADITAATQLSVLDYCGDVPWAHNRGAKRWYAQIKTRPTFSYLLNDRVPGMVAHRDYSKLEF